MQQLSDEQRKQVYTDCLAVMQTEYYSARQFDEAAIKIAETRAYETAGYHSFENFLSTKFEHAFRNTKRIYQLCKFAEVVEDVTKFVEKESLQILVPVNESQTRALAPLPHEDRGPAYALAFEEAGGLPTGAEVAATVAALRPSTDERISRLDTDRKAKPPPQTRSPYRKGFVVSAFQHNKQEDRVHFQVFKPGNSFKGWEPKTEYLQIDWQDFVWEVREMGFALVPIDQLETALKSEEDCPERSPGAPQASLDALDVPRDAAGKPMHPKLIAYYQKRGYFPDYVPPTPEQIAAQEEAEAAAALADDDDAPLPGSFIGAEDNIAAEAMAKLFSDEYPQ